MARKNNTARKQEATVETVETVETVVETTPAVQKMPTIAELEKLGHSTKSAKIRFLGSQGFKPGEIAKHLGVIYQHAYNVLKKPLKRPVAETPATEEGDSNQQEA